MISTHRADPAIAPSGRHMRAVVCRRYGDPSHVLDLVEISEPPIGDADVLVGVEAAAVNPADWRLVRAVPALARLQVGLRRPRFDVPGSDFSGRVLRVGGRVTTLAPGDEVFGTTFLHGFGAFGEMVAVDQRLVVRKPRNLSFAEAAAAPLAALTALQAIRDHGRVSADDRVLVIGASGGVGTFAVQIARALGAEVTGMCSARNLPLVRSLGATAVDYAAGGITGTGGRYDVIVQLAGTQSAIACRRALTGSGRLVQLSGDGGNRVTGPLGRVLTGRMISPLVSQTISSFTVRPNPADLEFLRAHLEAGVLTPVLDATYPLEDIRSAFAHVEAGHSRGKVVVSIGPSTSGGELAGDRRRGTRGGY